MYRWARNFPANQGVSTQENFVYFKKKQRRAAGTALDSGKGHGQGSAVSVTDPKAFLPGRPKAKVIAFTFHAQGISPLESGAVSVNG